MTASTMGMSLIWHGGWENRLGPNHCVGEHRSVITGSNKTRRPEGNSISQQACPSHVALRLLGSVPKRSVVKVGVVIGI